MVTNIILAIFDFETVLRKAGRTLENNSIHVICPFFFYAKRVSFLCKFVETNPSINDIKTACMTFFSLRKT